ncbi:TipAS antibiotic-recognition domain-containing protein [bacterium]|nr:MAG: TipAS antibiotic-recognition domain-containing protein [bacterium]
MKSQQNLERIIALKYFGFDLKHITELVGKDEDLKQHLKVQQTYLVEQIKQLHHANETINELIAAPAKYIDWSKIATLIRIYQMAKELHKTWAAKVYSPDQLKQFAELKTSLTSTQLKDIKKRWKVLNEKVKNNLDKDPQSPLARQLAKEWVDLVTEQYGDREDLKNAVCMAYKNNQIPSAPFDQKLWDWLEQASKSLK